MRKSFILSAAALFSMVFVGLGHATSASALERSSAPVEEKSEAGGSAFALIVGLVAVIAALAIVSGGGGDDRPASP